MFTTTPPNVSWMGDTYSHFLLLCYDSLSVRVAILFFLYLTSSVLVAEVGKPPDVAEADGDRDAGEEEVQLVPPLPPHRLPALLVQVGHLKGSG